MTVLQNILWLYKNLESKYYAFCMLGNNLLQVIFCKLATNSLIRTFFLTKSIDCIYCAVVDKDDMTLLKMREINCPEITAERHELPKLPFNNGSKEPLVPESMY
jgi:hypothetical protein